MLNCVPAIADDEETQFCAVNGPVFNLKEFPKEQFVSLTFSSLGVKCFVTRPIKSILDYHCSGQSEDLFDFYTAKDDCFSVQTSSFLLCPMGFLLYFLGTP